MVDRKTKVVIEAETKGFEKAKREVKGTFGELDAKGNAASMKKLNYEISEMSRQFRGLKSGLKDINKMLRMKDGATGVADMRKEIAKLTQELDKLRQKGGAGGSGGGGGGGIKGGFLSGLLQGAGMGEVFPQQGFGRNVAGRIAGSGVRRAGSFAGGAFSGASGFAQGLSGIPVVGGFMAGQMQSMLGHAQAGQQSLQERRALLPMMNSGSVAAQLQAARGAVGSQDAYIADAMAKAPSASGDRLRALKAGSAAAAFAQKSAEDAKGGGPASFANVVLPHLKAATGTSTQGPTAAVWKQASDASLAADAKARKDARSKGINAYQRALSKAENSTLSNPFTAIEKLGKSMGIMPGQAIQMAGQVAQGSGGGLGQFGSTEGKSFMRQAFGMQQALGLSGQDTGAFAAYARHGNVAGGLGGGEQAMLDAVYQGTKMALGQAEMTRYMQSVSSSMAQFEQTGMALDPGAIGAIGSVMARNVGGARGAELGRGVTQAAQRIAQNGITNQAELMLMTEMFGYDEKEKGSYARSMVRAASGTAAPGGSFKRFKNRIGAGATSPEQGQLLMQSVFKQLGINMAAPEANLLAGGDGGNAQRLKETQHHFDAAQKSAKRLDYGDIAADSAASGLKRGAGIQARKAGIGRGGALSVAQTFEENQLGVTAAVARMAPEMNAAARALGEAATKGMNGAVDIIKRLEGLVDRVEILVPGAP